MRELIIRSNDYAILQYIKNYLLKEVPDIEVIEMEEIQSKT